MTECDLLRVMHGHQRLCQCPPRKRTRRQALGQELTAQLNQLESELGKSLLLNVVFRRLRGDIEKRSGPSVLRVLRQLPELWDSYETIRACLQHRHQTAARTSLRR